MKIVFTSDLHVHPSKIGSVDGGRDRLADGLSALDQTLAFAREHGAAWIFGGDFKVPKSVWPVESLNGVLATLKRYDDVRKFAIPGNHDTVDGQWGSGLEPLREFVTVYDRPTFGTWEDERTPKKVKARDVVTFAAWPWGAGHRDELPAFLDEATAARKRGETVVLLAHLMFEGLLPQADAQHPGKSLPPEAFRPGEAFDVALVGDVHRGQVYLAPTPARPVRAWKPFSEYAARVSGGSKTSPRRPLDATETPLSGLPVIPLRPAGPWRGEVWYPGSPYAQSWGERDDGPKGALLVDLATGAVELLPVRAPRFREVVTETSKDIDALAAVSIIADSWKNDIVRLIVPESVLAQKGVISSIRFLRKQSGARDIQAIPRRDAVVVQRAPVHGGMTPAELVREYSKARPLEGSDPSVVERAGIALLVERDEGDGRVA